MWSATELATANRDLIQLAGGTGEVSAACGPMGRRTGPCRARAPLARSRPMPRLPAEGAEVLVELTQSGLRRPEMTYEALN